MIPKNATSAIVAPIHAEDAASVTISGAQGLVGSASMNAAPASAAAIDARIAQPNVGTIPNGSGCCASAPGWLFTWPLATGSVIRSRRPPDLVGQHPVGQCLGEVDAADLV